MKGVVVVVVHKKRVPGGKRPECNYQLSTMVVILEGKLRLRKRLSVFDSRGRNSRLRPLDDSHNVSSPR
jgi:hypothetical protein